MRIIIFGNKFRNEVADYTATLIRALKRHNGVSIVVEEEFLQFLKERNVCISEIDETVSGTDFTADTAFSIGGDGTFIRSSA
ncbi:MAG: NAD kinase, partial [Paludibacteraceae bacterium]|nr:NAD kinase [Paludibacteraceae bacterium]